MMQIGMERAWDYLPSRGSTSVIVCVQDTGVAYENFGTYTVAPDLSGLNFVLPYDAEDDDGHPNDVNAHGTHVTGTIAQRTHNSVGVAGMADGVSIMPVRTLGGGGTHAVFAEGVTYATDNGADIINYSGGGSDSTTKHDAVIYAADNGVLYIAAMGNDNTEDPPSGYPGRYPEAVGVVAIDYTLARAPYSNYGADSDISAPGGDNSEDIFGDGYADGVLQQTYATTGNPTSGYTYRFFEGTSMATPHVSGLAALLWSQGVYNTPGKIKTHIYETAKDMGDPGKDNVFGWGRIRADVALAPWLSWVGTGGYVSDGVDPESGDSVAAATSFNYRVKYRDASGAAPTTARVVIERLKCAAGGGVAWEVWAGKNMTLESGTIAGGAVYHVATTLPTNHTYRYWFKFYDSTGAKVLGPPTNVKTGPAIYGAPYLCWTGMTYYTTDGVHPDSGPVDTTFEFKVLYLDSRNEAPTTAELRIKRNGALYKTKALLAAAGGSYRFGKVYKALWKASQSGTYEYRFVFTDASGTASGNPSLWTPGPTIDGAAGASLTGLAALPTAAGAQVTFRLAGAANVTATVTNVAGRPIRTLVEDRALEAGPQTLLWDRKAGNGLPVPAGLYLIRVTAREPEGGQSSGLATLALR